MSPSPFRRQPARPGAVRLKWKSKRQLLSNQLPMAKRIYMAEWVLPVTSPPMRDAAVVIENDRIVFVGSRSTVESRTEFNDVERMDFGRAAILPGFINTHSHLELTLMRGFLEDLAFRT